MSGAAGGAVLIPLALAAIPIMGVVLVGGALVAAGNVAVNMAVEYEDRRRREREEIRASGISADIAALSGEIKDRMDEQTRLNVKASEDMIREMESHREAVSAILKSGDPGDYSDYLVDIAKSRSDLKESMEVIQNEFLKNYGDEITRSMADISDTINRDVAKGIADMKALGLSKAALQKKAETLASGCIDDAKSKIASLKDGHRGKYFLNQEVVTLGEQLAMAEAQYNEGFYEASIAVASDVSIGALEGIYKADLMMQEWENYQKLSLIMASEIKAYMEAQAEITPDLKNELEKACGGPLDKKLEGIKLGDYTDALETGETKFDNILRRAGEMIDRLEKADPSNMSGGEIKRVWEELNDDLRSNAEIVINNALHNINNSFTRQGLSDKIIDFFESQGFYWDGHGYEDDNLGKALSLNVKKSDTKEELIITLAPDLANGRAIGATVEIDQISGNGADEETKALYREVVTSIVTGNYKGAECDLKCDGATFESLSPRRAELTERITVR